MQAIKNRLDLKIQISLYWIQTWNYAVFRKSKNRTKKLNSDLFNYSRLYTRCLSFLKIVISVVLTLSLRKLTVDFQTAFMVFRNNTWNMVPNNSTKIHNYYGIVFKLSKLHSNVKPQAESKASEENVISLWWW